VKRCTALREARFAHQAFGSTESFNWVFNRVISPRYHCSTLTSVPMLVRSMITVLTPFACKRCAVWIIMLDLPI